MVHAFLDGSGFTISGVSATLLVTVIAVFLGAIVYANYFDKDDSAFKQQRDPNLPPPTEIVSLYIYPIKSCRGIQVQQTRLRRSGLDLDRNWMFVDASDDKFLTIRSDPTMTLIDTTISEDFSDLIISIHGTEDSVTVPARPTADWLKQNTNLQQVEIWEQKTDGWAYNESINAIFSKYFSKPVKLIYKGPEPRFSGGNADKTLYGEKVPHKFADVMSVQIASEASLADLNKRLKERQADSKTETVTDELTVERFRPNIVIKGDPDSPWAEDRWKKVQLVTSMPEREQLWRLKLDVVARCARCQVPNVNPDTAEKHAHEPWDTLMKFRRVDQGGVAKYKPCFGMLCLPANEGWVKVGGLLEVVELTDGHRYNEAKFADL